MTEVVTERPYGLQLLLGFWISKVGEDVKDVKVGRVFENPHIGVGKGLAHGTEALDQCRPDDIQFFFGFVKNCMVANGAMQENRNNTIVIVFIYVIFHSV